MKLLHTADIHIDTATHSRVNPRTGLKYAAESNIAVLKEMADKAIEEKVDLFLLSGDLVSHGRPLPETYMHLANALSPLVEAGIPIEITEGNHERLGISAVQRTAAHVLGTILHQGTERASQKGTQIVLTDFGKAQVLSMPYPSKSRILSLLKEEGKDVNSGDEVVVKYVLDQVSRVLDSPERDTSLPLIISGHFTATLGQGSLRLGSERELASSALEVSIPLAPLLDHDPAYIALGHIHTPQKLHERAYYCGSPNKLTFSDAGDTKGYNLVYIEGNALSVDTISTKNVRDMGVIDLEAGDIFDPEMLVPHGAYQVRLPAGELAIPKEIASAAQKTGATLSARRKPATKEKKKRVVIDEAVTPQSALSTWLTGVHNMSEDEAKPILERFATV